MIRPRFEIHGSYEENCRSTFVLKCSVQFIVPGCLLEKAFQITRVGEGLHSCDWPVKFFGFLRLTVLVIRAIACAASNASNPPFPGQLRLVGVIHNFPSSGVLRRHEHFSCELSR